MHLMSDFWKGSHLTISRVRGAAYFTIAMIVLGSIISSVGISPASHVSVEAHFADYSRGGVAIVPASCPSDPHYTGACNVKVCDNALNLELYPRCVCPTGQVQAGSICINQPSEPGGCINGLDVTRYPSCTCPQGSSVSGNSCVAEPGLLCPNGTAMPANGICTDGPLCPDGSVVPATGVCTGSLLCADGSPIDPDLPCPDALLCPDGTPIFADGSCDTSCPFGTILDSSGVCMPLSECSRFVGLQCTSAPNSCGMTSSSGTVRCNGTCSSPTPADSMCTLTCFDGSAPTGGSCPPCPLGYTQVGNQCFAPLEPITPTPEPFITTPDGYHATGNLEIRPSLVRKGLKARVYWQVTRVSSCTVVGSNGDDITAGLTPAQSVFSGTSGIETSAIVSRTTYSLTCVPAAGTTGGFAPQSKAVNVLPSWLER